MDASLIAWSIHLGYHVPRNGRFGGTPNTMCCAWNKQRIKTSEGNHEFLTVVRDASNTVHHFAVEMGSSSMHDLQQFNACRLVGKSCLATHEPGCTHAHGPRWSFFGQGALLCLRENAYQKENGMVARKTQNNFTKSNTAYITYIGVGLCK